MSKYYSKYYVGVGSRTTPDNILSDMEEIAYWMARKGWTLRSGRAVGADTSFEKGCDRVNGKKEIFIANDALNDTKAIFSFLIKMALTGLFYVLFRIFTFGIGKTESKAVGEAATMAGSQLQSV